MQPTSERATLIAPHLVKTWLANLFGLVWLGALELVIFSIPDHHLFLLISGGVGVVIIAALAFVYFRWPSRPLRLFIVVGAAVLTAVSFGATFFVGSITVSEGLFFRQLPAHATAVTSAILLTAWLHHGQRQVLDPLRGRFAIFVMTVALWAGFLSIQSWVVYLNLSPWWLPVAGMVLTVLAAWIVWQDAGVPWSRSRTAVVSTAILGAESLVVAWWLPTALPVGATVAATCLTLYIQVCRHLWLESWYPGRGQRYLWAGSLVIMASLLSARWV